jgi:hypothetical protein
MANDPGFLRVAGLIGSLIVARLIEWLGYALVHPVSVLPSSRDGNAQGRSRLWPATEAEARVLGVEPIEAEHEYGHVGA